MQEKLVFWNVTLGMGNFQIAMLDIAIKFGKAWRFANGLCESGRQFRDRSFKGTKPTPGLEGITWPTYVTIK